jgi:hypothetical protein
MKQTTSMMVFVLPVCVIHVSLALCSTVNKAYCESRMVAALLLKNK